MSTYPFEQLEEAVTLYRSDRRFMLGLVAVGLVFFGLTVGGVMLQHRHNSQPVVGEWYLRQGERILVDVPSSSRSCVASLAGSSEAHCLVHVHDGLLSAQCDRDGTVQWTCVR